MLEFLALITIGGYYLSRNFESRRLLDRLNLGDDKLKAPNDRGKLLFDPQEHYDRNEKMGKVKWDGMNVKPPATLSWWKKPTPIGSDVADFTHEGNQWLRSPEFRKIYVDNYRNAWSTESDFALRNQLVTGYQKETITKGKTLQHISKADGKYNPHGINLYRYHCK